MFRPLQSSDRQVDDALDFSQLPSMTKIGKTRQSKGSDTPKVDVAWSTSIESCVRRLEEEVKELQQLTLGVPRLKATLECLRPLEARACAEVLSFGGKHTATLHAEDARADALEADLRRIRDLFEGIKDINYTSHHTEWDGALKVIHGSVLADVAAVERASEHAAAQAASHDAEHRRRGVEEGKRTLRFNTEFHDAKAQEKSLAGELSVTELLLSQSTSLQDTELVPSYEHIELQSSERKAADAYLEEQASACHDLFDGWCSNQKRDDSGGHTMIGSVIGDGVPLSTSQLTTKEPIPEIISAPYNVTSPDASEEPFAAADTACVNILEQEPPRRVASPRGSSSATAEIRCLMVSFAEWHHFTRIRRVDRLLCGSRCIEGETSSESLPSELRQIAGPDVDAGAKPTSPGECGRFILAEPMEAEVPQGMTRVQTPLAASPTATWSPWADVAAQVETPQWLDANAWPPCISNPDVASTFGGVVSNSVWGDADDAKQWSESSAIGGFSDWFPCRKPDPSPHPVFNDALSGFQMAVPSLVEERQHHTPPILCELAAPSCERRRSTSWSPSSRARIPAQTSRSLSRSHSMHSLEGDVHADLDRCRTNVSCGDGLGINATAANQLQTSSRTVIPTQSCLGSDTAAREQCAESALGWPCSVGSGIEGSPQLTPPLTPPLGALAWPQEIPSEVPLVAQSLPSQRDVLDDRVSQLSLGTSDDTVLNIQSVPDQCPSSWSPWASAERGWKPGIVRQLTWPPVWGDALATSGINAVSAPKVFRSTSEPPHRDYANVEVGGLGNENLSEGTRLQFDAPMGSKVLQVVSHKWCTPGEVVRINPGGWTEEDHIVIGFGSLLLADRLKHWHGAGEPVVRAPEDLHQKAKDSQSEDADLSSVESSMASEGAPEAACNAMPELDYDNDDRVTLGANDGQQLSASAKVSRVDNRCLVETSEDSSDAQEEAPAARDRSRRTSVFLPTNSLPSHRELSNDRVQRTPNVSPQMPIQRVSSSPWAQELSATVPPLSWPKDLDLRRPSPASSPGLHVRAHGGAEQFPAMPSDEFLQRSTLRTQGSAKWSPWAETAAPLHFPSSAVSDLWPPSPKGTDIQSGPRLLGGTCRASMPPQESGCCSTSVASLQWQHTVVASDALSTSPWAPLLAKVQGNPSKPGADKLGRVSTASHPWSSAKHDLAGSNAGATPCLTELAGGNADQNSCTKRFAEGVSSNERLEEPIECAFDVSSGSADRTGLETSAHSSDHECSIVNDGECHSESGSGLVGEGTSSSIVVDLDGEAKDQSLGNQLSASESPSTLLQERTASVLMSECDAQFGTSWWRPMDDDGLEDEDCSTTTFSPNVSVEDRGFPATESQYLEEEQRRTQSNEVNITFRDDQAHVGVVENIVELPKLDQDERRPFGEQRSPSTSSCAAKPSPTSQMASTSAEISPCTLQNRAEDALAKSELVSIDGFFAEDGQDADEPLFDSLGLEVVPLSAWSSTPYTGEPEDDKLDEVEALGEVQMQPLDEPDDPTSIASHEAATLKNVSPYEKHVSLMDANVWPLSPPIDSELSEPSVFETNRFSRSLWPEEQQHFSSDIGVLTVAQADDDPRLLASLDPSNSEMTTRSKEDVLQQCCAGELTSSQSTDSEPLSTPSVESGALQTFARGKEWPAGGFDSIVPPLSQSCSLEPLSETGWLNTSVVPFEQQLATGDFSEEFSSASAWSDPLPLAWRTAIEVAPAQEDRLGELVTSSQSVGESAGFEMANWFGQNQCHSSAGNLEVTKIASDETEWWKGSGGWPEQEQAHSLLEPDNSFSSKEGLDGVQLSEWPEAASVARVPNPSSSSGDEGSGLQPEEDDEMEHSNGSERRQGSKEEDNESNKGVSALGGFERFSSSSSEELESLHSDDGARYHSNMACSELEPAMLPDVASASPDYSEKNDDVRDPVMGAVGDAVAEESDTEVDATTSAESPLALSPVAVLSRVDHGELKKLKVCIIEARGLRHVNLTGIYCYCECTVQRGGPHMPHRIARTTTCKSAEPSWDETHEINPWKIGETLEFTIYDKGLFGSRIQGKAILLSNCFYPHGFDGKLQIEGLPSATLHVSVGVEGDSPENFKASTHESVVSADGPPQRLSVSIVCASGLKQMNVTGDHNYCVCQVRRADIKWDVVTCQTKTIFGSNDPVWNETFEMEPWWREEPLEFVIYDRGALVSKMQGKVLLPGEYIYPDGFEGDLPVDGLPAASLHVRVTLLGISSQGITLRSEASRGSKVLDVTYHEGFTRGQVVRVNPGGLNQEDHVIVAFGSLLLANSLDRAHKVGERVVPVPAALQHSVLDATEILHDVDMSQSDSGFFVEGVVDKEEIRGPAHCIPSIENGSSAAGLEYIDLLETCRTCPGNGATDDLAHELSDVVPGTSSENLVGQEVSASAWALEVRPDDDCFNARDADRTASVSEYCGSNWTYSSSKASGAELSLAESRTETIPGSLSDETAVDLHLTSFDPPGDEGTSNDVVTEPFSLVEQAVVANEDSQDDGDYDHNFDISCKGGLQAPEDISPYEDCSSNSSIGDISEMPRTARPSGENMTGGDDGTCTCEAFEMPRPVGHPVVMMPNREDDSFEVETQSATPVRPTQVPSSSEFVEKSLPLPPNEPQSQALHALSSHSEINSVDKVKRIPESDLLTLESNGAALLDANSSEIDWPTESNCFPSFNYTPANAVEGWWQTPAEKMPRTLGHENINSPNHDEMSSFSIVKPIENQRENNLQEMEAFSTFGDNVNEGFIDNVMPHWDEKGDGSCSSFEPETKPITLALPLDKLLTQLPTPRIDITNEPEDSGREEEVLERIRGDCLGDARVIDDEASSASSSNSYTPDGRPWENCSGVASASSPMSSTLDPEQLPELVEKTEWPTVPIVSIWPEGSTWADVPTAASWDDVPTAASWVEVAQGASTRPYAEQDEASEAELERIAEENRQDRLLRQLLQQRLTPLVELEEEDGTLEDAGPDTTSLGPTLEDEDQVAMSKRSSLGKLATWFRGGPIAAASAVAYAMPGSPKPGWVAGVSPKSAASMVAQAMPTTSKAGWRLRRRSSSGLKKRVSIDSTESLEEEESAPDGALAKEVCVVNSKDDVLSPNLGARMESSSTESDRLGNSGSELVGGCSNTRTAFRVSQLPTVSSPIVEEQLRSRKLRWLPDVSDVFCAQRDKGGAFSNAEPNGSSGPGSEVDSLAAAAELPTQPFGIQVDEAKAAASSSWHHSTNEANAWGAPGWPQPEGQGAIDTLWSASPPIIFEASGWCGGPAAWENAVPQTASTLMSSDPLIGDTAPSISRWPGTSVGWPGGEDS